MNLVVGENSYMTLDEANNIISSSLLSTSMEHQFWDGLSDDDKCVLIINYTEVVDKQEFMYKGKKVNNSQKMEWPRVICGNNTDAPLSIKKGLLLNLLRDNTIENTDEGKLISMGVKSFADGGGARIEFADAGTSASNEYTKNLFGVYRKIWRTYFSEWSLII